MAYLLVLFVVGALALIVGGRPWLELVAVVGTALGALGLAYYTYDLARATQTAEAQTSALVMVGQQQADAAAEQLRLAGEQLEVSKHLAIESARARIDAGAPLVELVVHLATATLNQVVDGTPATLGNQQWTESELKDVVLEAQLSFALANRGSSPACLFFPSLNPDPERLSNSRLAPGTSWYAQAAPTKTSN